MIRIEKLPNGTLIIHDEEATRYVSHIDDATTLTDEQKARFKMLEAVDVGVELEGLGARTREDTYWLYGPIAMKDGGDVLDWVAPYTVTRMVDYWWEQQRPGSVTLKAAIPLLCNYCHAIRLTRLGKENK